MNINFKKLALGLPLAFLLSTTSLFSNEKVPTAQEMLKASKLKINYKDIYSGKIVEFAREDQESTSRSIALSMGLFLKAPFKDVLVELVNGDHALSGYRDAKFVRIEDTKNLKPYIKKMGFTLNEKKEINKLFDFEEGDAFNLSKEEIERWQKVKKTRNKNRRELASSFFQEVLEQRMQAYLRGGVNGIASYEDDGDDIEVSQGLKSSSIALNSFKRFFPEFYKDYINYPKVSSKKYKESFYYYKDVMDDRPVFMLKHRMVESKDNMLMVTERQFYISHGLDAIQMQLICLPYKDGTFIGLSSQSFTGKVAGFGRSIAVKVGRSMMSKQIRPMLESLQKKFNN